VCAIDDPHANNVVQRVRACSALARRDGRHVLARQHAVRTRAAEAIARLTMNSDPNGDAFMPNM
jgi:hypothetical protein